MECRQCGMELDHWQDCPKCDLPADQQNLDRLFVIDVAHNGESADQAETKIIAAVDTCLYEHYKGIKVIHGRGSHRGSGIIKSRATRLMRHLAEKHRGKFRPDRENEGASLILFN